MKGIKIAATIACSFIIVLFSLLITAEKSEIKLYEETVEMLMKQEGGISNREIEERFPILSEIRSNMIQLANLNQIIGSKTQGPAPMLSEEETLEFEYCTEKIRQLRKGIRTGLSQLTAIYAETQP